MPKSRIYLKIENHNFYHDIKFKKDFYDLGKIYEEKEIGEKTDSYNFIYQIPRTFYNNDMYIAYRDNNGKEIKIKLNTKELKLPKETKEYKINETLDFKESLLLDTTVKISDYQIEDTFKQDYNYCPSKGYCYNSLYYVIPSYTSYYTKSLLKLTYNYKKDQELNIDKTSTFIGMLNNFGKLCYKIGDKITCYSNLRLAETKINDYKYYIEVNQNIKQANEIWFEINVRDKMYKYNLKQEEV